MPQKQLSNGLNRIRHSLAHLLAAAVLKKFPDAKLGIGPTIENGFYYDFLLPKGQKFSETDLQGFEVIMRDWIRKKLTFRGERITAAQAKKLFANQPFKLELIQELVKERKPLTIYRTGDVFTDLCRGGHVKNTAEINADAFKLEKIAGAYWKGDEKRPQLQRIYGLAFHSKKELQEHLKLQEESRKRDHRRLGVELDLFLFSELVGGGLPLWTPKGTMLRDLLDNFVWELRRARGYERVDIPHLAKKALYEKSGHWEKFKDELMKITTREGHLFALKPMNCPHHVQIYARKKWSYRELPQRYASTTKVYRDEQSGELGGLTRVRSITQDDAHVFCRKSQIAEEMFAIWDIIEEFYAACGFPQLEVHLSFHDPKQPKKYLGSPKVWKEAETALIALAKKRLRALYNKSVKIDIGEAAFYGPKIDFLTKDSLGRTLQVATIQLDMNMPVRFRLNCINEKGEEEQIFMIHAAIMGSLERFLAAFLEHTGGNFPLWLAPIQTAVLPVGEKYDRYAKTVTDRLNSEGIRTELSNASETLGKRIRNAELKKIPYILVVGEKEQQHKSVNVRKQGEADGGKLHQSEMKLDTFIQKVRREIENKRE